MDYDVGVDHPTLMLPICFALAAFLYASVGHAGASGYLAVMAFFAVAPAVMKSSALCMNVVVATIALIMFSRAGYFRWRLLWPFALTSIPLAFLGGRIQLPSQSYRILVGIILAISALKLMWDVIAAWKKNRAQLHAGQPETAALRMPPLIPALLAGAAIGLLSGLTGTGGGIFLSPLLILLRWGHPRDSAGVAAAFILANSLSGLLGHWPTISELPPMLWLWCLAAATGGLLGSWYGSKSAPLPIFKLLLAIVLMIAAGKLALTP
jgi:uncharacterized protein